MSPLLQVAGLECVRQQRLLFSGMSFELQPGELLRVAGANGSGKTSLLRIMCGLLTPSAGEVRWNGAPIQGLREEFSRQLVYLGHAPAVKDDLTAEENLAIACRLAGIQAGKDSIREALARFGVPQLSFLKKLSQGQRRRAALARLCLAPSAPLWLLDEPFTALDVAGIEFLKTLMAGHARRGSIVVYTTHQDPGLAAARVVELG